MKPRIELVPTGEPAKWRLRDESGKLTGVFFDRLRDATRFLKLYADKSWRDKHIAQVQERTGESNFIYRMFLPNDYT